jgi:hypothetical protein
LDSYAKGVDKIPSQIEFVYHDRLGWNANPNNRTFHNEQGIAPPDRVFTTRPQGNKVRIALFGDSMTRASRGSALGWDNTWGYLLEKHLNQLGYQVEVMNFGVPAYGIDQAYLRWEIEGKQFNPDIVVFGFFSLDIVRCLEVEKAKNLGLYGGLFFTKPRFLPSRDSDQLKLVNSPTVSVDKIFDGARSFDELRHIVYDSVYQETKGDYQEYPWTESYLFNFLRTNWDDNWFTQMDYHKYDSDYDLEKEGAQLALKLINQFQRSTKQQQAEFVTVVLPSQLDLFHLKNGKSLRYAHLLDAISTFSPVIHAEEKMKSHEVEELFLPNDAHYSSLGNAVVAQIVSEFLVKHSHQLAGGKSVSLASATSH